MVRVNKKSIKIVVNWVKKRKKKKEKKERGRWMDGDGGRIMCLCASPLLWASEGTLTCGGAFLYPLFPFIQLKVDCIFCNVHKVISALFFLHLQKRGISPFLCSYINGESPFHQSDAWVWHVQKYEIPKREMVR